MRIIYKRAKSRLDPLLDFNRNEILVRDGKGRKDRVTMLPTAVKEPLRRHLEQSRKQYLSYLQHGFVGVALPYALERKYPSAGKEWGWQWVFPASKPCVWTLAPGSRRDTTSTSRFSRKPSRTRGLRLVSRSRPVHTHFAIPLRRIFWRMAMISGPFRSYWVTKT